MKIDLKTSSELVFYRSSLLSDLYADVCADYMEYLADARSLLKTCQMKCACWSAPYDGQNPAPQDPSSVERERSLSNLSAPVTNGDIPNRRSLGAEDAPAPVKRSISATEYEQKQSKPDLGPFLVTLFQKIERMPQNTFYVNLILTGVVSRLALYPQPLLRSFLLNYNMVLKPGVRSLFQVGDFLILVWTYLLLVWHTLICVVMLTDKRNLKVRYKKKNCPIVVDFINWFVGAKANICEYFGLHFFLWAEVSLDAQSTLQQGEWLKKPGPYSCFRSIKGHPPVWDADSSQITSTHFVMVQ